MAPRTAPEGIRRYPDFEPGARLRQASRLVSPRLCCERRRLSSLSAHRQRRIVEYGRIFYDPITDMDIRHFALISGYFYAWTVAHVACLYES